MSDRLPSFKYSHEIPHDTQLQHWILFVHKQIQKRKDRGAQTRIDPRAWSTTGCFAWMKLCSSGNPILISLRNSRVICFKKKKKNLFLNHLQLAVNWEMFSCNRTASFGSSAERLASLKKLSYHVWKKISVPAKVPDWHFLTYKKQCCILTTLFSISSGRDSFRRLQAKGEILSLLLMVSGLLGNFIIL